MTKFYNIPGLTNKEYLNLIENNKWDLAEILKNSWHLAKKVFVPTHRAFIMAYPIEQRYRLMENGINSNSFIKERWLEKCDVCHNSEEWLILPKEKGQKVYVMCLWCWEISHF